MPVSAVPAKPTLLALGTAGCPQTFSTIANIGDLQLPQFSSDEVDVTSHSTGNVFDDWVVTIRRGGQVTFPLYFVPGYAQHSFTNPEGLGFIWKEGQKRTYRVTFSDGSVWCYFDAFVTNYAINAPVAGVYTADVTFRVTGEPLFLQ